MPSYDYRCLATGTIHEVKHSLSLKATTWAELCALGNLEPGDIAPDSPVERLISAAGVVSSGALRNPEPPCGGGGCGRGACSFAA
jgi:predicted nucleic acid-binding Zn ribbon protein